MFAFIVGLFLYLCTRVSAETTLYIPGADEQPLSVQQIGTDGYGRTSWVIGPGTPTGTFTEVNVQFTATLVEGPSDAILKGSIPGGPAFSYSCAIVGSQADCQLVASDQTLTETTSIIEIVTPYVVQGGSGSSPSQLNSALPSLTLTSNPPNGSLSLSRSSPLTTPTSDLPQPTETPHNSARTHTRPKHHTSWVSLALGLIHVLHNII